MQLLFICSYSTPYLATDSYYTAKRLVANLGVHGFWHKQVKIVKAQKENPYNHYKSSRYFFLTSQKQVYKKQIFLPHTDIGKIQSVTLLYTYSDQATPEKIL
jgi:hypothetical protein